MILFSLISLLLLLFLISLLLSASFYQTTFKLSMLNTSYINFKGPLYSDEEQMMYEQN